MDLQRKINQSVGLPLFPEDLGQYLVEQYVYFYLEADTAGTIITITGLINLVELSLRQNSFALTNTTLGPILENINVE